MKASIFLNNFFYNIIFIKKNARNISHNISLIPLTKNDRFLIKIFNKIRVNKSYVTNWTLGSIVSRFLIFFFIFSILLSRTNFSRMHISMYLYTEFWIFEFEEIVIFSTRERDEENGVGERGKISEYRVE